MDTTCKTRNWKESPLEFWETREYRQTANRLQQARKVKSSPAEAMTMQAPVAISIRVGLRFLSENLAERKVNIPEAKKIILKIRLNSSEIKA